MGVLGIDQEYRVVSIRNSGSNITINGYGLSVISALKETPIKRNLYYEIKDKVLEETVENGRLVRRLRKTKVFGLHSTKEVRDQLIELLMERVRHHKDKFISPTLYEEMRGLEVKKERVEHSELTHDDQIFSYLLSLYVWYCGKNLRETFGIEKFGIKTEDSVDDVVDLTNGVEEVGSIIEEMVSLTRDDTDPLNRQLAQMNQAKGITFSEYVNKQKEIEEERLKIILQNPKVKEAYAKKYGITPDMVSVNSDGFGMHESLPDSVFTDFNKDISEMDQGSIYATLNHVYESGNTAYPEEDESQQ